MDKLDKQLAQAAQVKPRDIDYSARGKFQPELAKVPRAWQWQELQQAVLTP